MILATHIGLTKLDEALGFDGRQSRPSNPQNIPEVRNFNHFNLPNQPYQTGVTDEKCNMSLLQENRSFGRKNESAGIDHLFVLQLKFRAHQKISPNIRLGRGSSGGFIP